MQAAYFIVANCRSKYTSYYSHSSVNISKIFSIHLLLIYRTWMFLNYLYLIDISIIQFVSIF